MDVQVIVGTPSWTVNGVNIFSANLVRGLIDIGFAARILMTEQHSSMVTNHEPMMPLPTDIPIDELRLTGVESWGAHWGAMIRYLEERAPCVYIPNDDWRHSNICSQLSGKVHVVGVVHSDDPLHYVHVSTLGRYWDAIVTTSDAIAVEVISQNPGLAKRVVTIPIGVPVPERLPKRESTVRPLLLVYQGRLVQHQKRVFDLPKIVGEALNLGVPIELTLIGDGTERERLMARSSQLIELGAMRFLEVAPHARLMELLGKFDVYLLTSEFEGMPNALGEAMASGCVPIVTDIRSGVRELVRDGESGFVVPVGDISAFARRLSQLHHQPELRSAMSTKAREAVIDGGFSVQTMVDRYAALFRSLLTSEAASRFRRPRGNLRLPPLQMGRVRTFQLPEAYRFEDLGVLPSTSWDYDGYARELDGVDGRGLPPWHAKMPRPYPNVIVSATSGRVSGVDIFSANLVRGMRALGRDGHVLMTCPDDSAPDPLPFPDDIPVVRLPVSRRMAWKKRWALLSSYLERNAPCIYIPNYDWRNSCISPTLSQKVCVVGIVHSDDPQHYEHVSRLGRYWNSVVAVSNKIANRVMESDESLSARLVVIPYGVEIPRSLPQRQPGPNGSLRIVYAGRLVQRQKRVLDLPKIFSALVDRGVPAELTVIGGGEEEAALKAACSGWIGTGQVRFMGTLSNREVLRVFEQSDILILTSEFEGLPVSLLEAMAHGCVPVVTDIESGIPEVVRQGETGYRLPLGDIRAFAECLERLQADSALLRSLSVASYNAVRTGGYSVEDMAVAYISLFERVLVEAELLEFQRPRGGILPPPNSPSLTGYWQPRLGEGLLRQAVESIRCRLAGRG
jgi:glycosyltransferase involved in cell wall biosynthesis